MPFGSQGMLTSLAFASHIGFGASQAFALSCAVGASTKECDTGEQSQCSTGFRDVAGPWGVSRGHEHRRGDDAWRVMMDNRQVVAPA